MLGEVGLLMRGIGTKAAALCKLTHSTRSINARMP